MSSTHYQNPQSHRPAVVYSSSTTALRPSLSSRRYKVVTTTTTSSSSSSAYSPHTPATSSSNISPSSPAVQQQQRASSSSSVFPRSYPRKKEPESDWLLRVKQHKHNNNNNNNNQGGSNNNQGGYAHSWAPGSGNSGNYSKQQERASWRPRDEKKNDDDDYNNTTSNHYSSRGGGGKQQQHHYAASASSTSYHTVASSASRLQLLLQKRRQQQPQQTKNPRRVIHHLDELDDTFTSNNTSSSSNCGTTMMRKTTSRLVTAAHNKTLESSLLEEESSSSLRAMQPPQLYRLHTQPQDETMTTTTTPNTSTSLTSTSTSMNQSFSPQSTSRVRAIKEQLWGIQGEQLKSSPRKQETSVTRKQQETTTTTTTPTRVTPLYGKSPYSATTTTTTLVSSSTMRDIKPPATNERSTSSSRLDDKLSRRSRSLSPHHHHYHYNQQRSRSGTTTQASSSYTSSAANFSPRYVQAASRMTNTIATPERAAPSTTTTTSRSSKRSQAGGSSSHDAGGGGGSLTRSPRTPTPTQSSYSNHHVVTPAAAIWSAREQQQQQQPQHAPFHAANNSNPYTSLLTQLQTVDRSKDPSVALAQIDAILKQQQQQAENGRVTERSVVEEQSIWRQPTTTRTTTRAVVANQQPVVNGDDDSDDDSSGDDDDTSVSSITNPTYGHFETSPSKAFPSSRGQPRPSKLSNYANIQAKPKHLFRDEDPADAIAAVNENLAKNKSSKKKKKRVPSPPPASIQTRLLSKEPYPWTEDHAQQSEKMSGLGKEETRKQQTKTAAAASKTIDRPTNSEDVAIKLSQWDQLTDSGSRVSPSDNPNTMLHENVDTSPKRPHPWDSSIPRSHRVALRETSMEAADGLEAELTPQLINSPTTSNSSSAASPSRSLRIARVRNGTEQRLSKPEDLLSIGEEVNYGKKQYFQTAREGNRPTKDRDAGSSSMTAERLVTNSLSYDLNNLSHDFDLEKVKYTNNNKPKGSDSGWVAVPPSSFFPSIPLEQPEKQSRQMHSLNGVAPETFYEPYLDATMDKKRHGRSTNPFDDKPQKQSSSNPFDNDSLEHKVPISTNPFDNSSRSSSSGKESAAACRGAGDLFGGEMEEQSCIEVALELAPSRNTIRRLRQLAPPQQDEALEQGSDPKYSGGIQGLLKRRNSCGRDRSSSASATTYCSVASPLSRSSGRSRSKESQTPSQSTRGSARSFVNHGRSFSRGRRMRSKSPSRDRARSMDDRFIRNPSLARKFSRLLRVYDRDPLADDS